MFLCSYRGSCLIVHICINNFIFAVKDISFRLYYFRIEDEDDDDFIPFADIPIVSKFGPISRAARAKMKETAPVQANAMKV